MLKTQPAYSPELNPQERIWKWLRRVVTHNHWFATLREQVEAIRNRFRYLAGVKEQVQRLCGLKTPSTSALMRAFKAWAQVPNESPPSAIPASSLVALARIVPSHPRRQI
jgi:hypothetical protein